MLPAFTKVGKDAMINVQPSWPQWKIKSDASFGGQVLFENLTFSNYRSGRTYCGTEQRVFRLTEYQADYIPLVRARNIKFVNVDQEAFIYLFSPPNRWANTDDCGEFPCTGPNNVMLKFEKTSYSGLITPRRRD
jgi:hypothetical protein